MQKSLIKRTSCDICGESKDIEVILSVPYADQKLLEVVIARYCGNMTKSDIEGAHYELAHCKKCNYIFQTYVPSEKFAQQIYSYPQERIPESIAKHTDASLGYYMENAFLVEKMGYLLGGAKPHGQSVLDFGMGWGGFLSMAKSFGYRVFGVDTSNERRAFAQGQGIACAEHLDDLRENRFHFIQLDQTLEHVTRPLEILKELVSYLHDRGIVYISVPDGRMVAGDIKKGRINLFRKVAYPLEHINCFTHESLVRIAKEAGLRELRPYEVAKLLCKGASLWRNVHLVQATVEYWYRRNTSTSLYFTKR